MSVFVPLLIIGAIAGILSGMFGIGGGAVIVPALILVFGFTQTAANGTSLAALLLPVSIFGCIAYYRAGKLKIYPATALALGQAVATWYGAVLALNLPRAVLQDGYGIFLLLMTWRYLDLPGWLAERRRAVAQLEEEVKPAEAEPTPVDFNSPRVLALCIVIGLVAGVASGLFGIGGGVVIVPALMLFLGFDQKMAVGTSLGSLLPPVRLPGVIGYALAENAVVVAAPPALTSVLPQYGDVVLWAAAPLAVLLMIGAFFGARLTLRLPARTVQRLYGIFLLVVGLRFLLG